MATAWPPSAVYTWTPSPDPVVTPPVDFDVYAPDDDHGRVTALVIVHFALQQTQGQPS